ncbi:MAG: class I SAM-dependent methyltransferase [Patescibacteria group bacterium]
MEDFKKTKKYYSYARPEMLKFVPTKAKNILDVGCGEGLFVASLNKKSDFESWGVEINKEVAEIAKNNINKVLVGDVFELLDSIPNNYFDCIVFNDVLEHMENPYRVLEKIKTKLSPSGVVVCSIPNVRHVRVLRDLLFKKQWKYEESGILDKTHLRFFTKKSMVDMFEDLDYQVEKIEGINGTKWWQFFPINILTFGFFSDTRYIQFACVVKPK